MKKIEIVAKAIQRHEGFYTPEQYPPKGSLAFRNNNPGNLVFGDLAKAFGAKSYYEHPTTKHKFAIFPSYEQGFQALCRLIENACSGKSSIYSPEMTILQFFTKYAPIRENGVVVPNKPYASSVAKDLGQSVNDQIKTWLEQAPQADQEASERVFHSQVAPSSVAGKRLGTCKDTIAQSGCALVSTYNWLIHKKVIKMTLLEYNQFCIDKKIFVSGCGMVFPKLAEVLGILYEKTYTKPDNRECIAETNHYAKKGVPQHFFNLLKDGKRVDPLDAKPAPEANDYKIVSYRVLKLKETEKKEEEKKEEPKKEEPKQPDPTHVTPVEKPEPVPTPENLPEQEQPQPEVQPSAPASVTDVLSLVKALSEFIHNLGNLFRRK